MALQDLKAKRAWLVQATMIVLPVVVLAAFGLFSLRQDRLMAQHESADRAQLLADSLWPRIWSIVGDTNASGHPFSFEVDDRVPWFSRRLWKPSRHPSF